MSRVLGRGRYIYGTYPQGPGGGGGAGAASVPLSRQRFIDGDTAQSGLNGSAAEPFKTIEQFMTVRDADLTSSDNARANFVGWLTPSVLGYVEAVQFPPYASTELRADSMSLAGGTLVTGNMTWNNSAGPFVPANSAVVSVHNVTVSGNFTVTDDVGAPNSIVSISGDEGSAGLGAIIGGSFISSSTVKLLSALFNNVHIFTDIDAWDEISVGTAAEIIITGGSLIGGDITAQGLSCDDAALGSIAIIVGTNNAAFHNTAFSGVNPVLTSPLSVFDGPSWNSFMEAGGTRAVSATGSVVLVEGGANVGLVEGAALTVAASVVSLNGSGTGVVAPQTGSGSGNHYSTSNGVVTTVTIKTGGGEALGDTMLITKTDLGANVVAVKNSAGGQIASIPTLAKGFVLARFNGTDWVFAAGGSMLA